MLIGTKKLIGGTESKFLPKVYVVNGKCYVFLNAAKRAAFGTNYPIEVMTAEEAWEIFMHLPAYKLRKTDVEWDFDQTGSTFDGCLFCDNIVKACAVPNPEIKKGNKII